MIEDIWGRAVGRHSFYQKTNDIRVGLIYRVVSRNMVVGAIIDRYIKFYSSHLMKILLIKLIIY